MAELTAASLRINTFIFAMGSEDYKSEFELFEVTGIKSNKDRSSTIFINKYDKKDRFFYREEANINDFIARVSMFNKIKFLSRNEALSLIKLSEQIDKQKGGEMP